MSQDLRFIQIKDFLDIEDHKKIKKDMIKDFDRLIKDDKLDSGNQTNPRLHLQYESKHWKKFYDKIDGVMSNLFKMNNIKEKNIAKSWCLRISKPQKNFFHKHVLTSDTYTSVYYLQNENYELGTHLKGDNSIDILPGHISEVIIPGYQNSLVVFSGLILHDAVFPKYVLNKPRYTIVTDYE